MSQPYIGDIVYIDDTKHPNYRQRGEIIAAIEIRVYSYDADYQYTIRLDSGEIIKVGNSDTDQVSFKKPIARSRRVKQDREKRIRAELVELDRQEAQIKARRKDLTS